ncbi:Uncharacterised protein [Mycobacterium tuberculosis]|nr:Uncharacterised protein [Mycobacterium tuberculosis]
MEALFKKIGVNYKKIMLKDDFECYLTNANQDKIIMCVEVNSPDDMLALTNFIPHKGKEISEVLSTTKDKDEVDYRIPISRFLWDLYLVGLHKVNETGFFDSVKVSDVQRDRFVARKIIIEYISEEELYAKFQNTIFPHIELDECISKIEKINEELVSEIIKDVKISDKEQLDTLDVFNYVDQVVKALETKGD